MPFATVNNTRLFYRLEGTEGLPVLVLSHSLGCDHGMWQPQMPDLLQYFQVLRYDTRGHGASGVPAGDYTIEQLGRDVLALADALNLRAFCFCGLSMGGAVGQWLALNTSQRLTALVLANTSPKFANPELWNERRRAVLEGGMQSIGESIMQRFFSAEVRAQGDPNVHSIRSVLLGCDPIGYAGCCAALRDMDHRELLTKIAVPTLVIGDDRDVSTPWAEHGAILAQKIPGAQAVRVPAAHLSNLGKPRAFTTALLEFLLSKTNGAADSLEAGMQVRRAILGHEHVDRAVATSNEFTRDFQSLITRYAWGTVWTRPGLDRRTRRLLVLAITASVGRWEEFRLHLGAALRHGLEPCDVKEVLLQAAIYAGVPAANTAFHIAAEEIEKHAGAEAQ